ncbi:hypothetical protein FTO60_05345 [Octadecabacter sp. SW4]|uniref:hypothetical protein n=1 Tax=Octadecabacter sp. SW4 TaxID=2602067 RepID=UPI0011C1F346|nr:hypothetical protein [Octadecabacter sp. SW4]QEE35189.1 hypothetical protein FTO60_05345 [Octadecabacter sp. SW4]|tara:strand:+ start:529 stop:822 length:294 start_codon:yes stop_codon:yes gene_type:complete
MDPIVYPIAFFIIGGLAAYGVGRIIGYKSVWIFAGLAAVGYLISFVSGTQSTGQYAGVAQILIALFVITPVLVGALVGGVIGGYHRQRKMIERLNDD